MIAEFPLFVFTTLAGLAAGAYIMAALFPDAVENPKRPWFFPLVVLVLLGVGLLGVLGHLARPQLFYFALANPQAGITQEAYASMLFGVVVLVDLVMCARKGACPRGLRLFGAVVGLVLTVIMGLAYYEMVGVQPWHTPLTIALFVVGDLGMGAALYALFKEGAYGERPYLYTTVALEAVLACVMAAFAARFGGLGLGAIPFVVALVVGPVAHVALALYGKGGKAKWIPALACACAIVGVAIARYAFYAAYMG